VAQKLVGQNYTTPDLHAKVTGRAKYAEDYRADGMLFTKLLVSQMPQALDGVKAILTPDDLPTSEANVELGEGVAASAQPERVVTYEPVYVGEPIVAVAAVSEDVAAQAIELIDVQYEPLPFATDPVDSLRPGSANARLQGNVWKRPPAPANGRGRGGAPEISELKWTAEDFANAPAGQLPMGEATDEWTLGDPDGAMGQADLVIDRTFITPSTSHQPLETRTAMAYWQNGKLYLHGSTQSTVQTVRSVAGWVGIEPENVVIISEYTGGGFGSKIPGSLSMSIPAFLSKMAGAPVMMRITRDDEQAIGRARTGITARIKVGFRKDGRVMAVDGLAIGENGPYNAQGDPRSAGDIISLVTQAPNMRWRTISVLTNTPPKTSQRAPGGMQGIGIIEPVLAEAARKLGIDELELHLINAPSGKAEYGAANAAGRRSYTTSCFAKEALQRGAELFNYADRKAVNGQRNGSKVRGIGVALSAYSAGSIGYDGLLVIRPDGKVQIQSGIGNLGTEAVIDVHRVAAELLDVPWEHVEIVWGNTTKFLPWTCASGGSQTTHAMTRAAHAVGTAAVAMLKELAAAELGGRPDDYVVANERVSRRGGGAGLTFAQAAERAIRRGGKFDGHEPPDGVNEFTKASVSGLAGQGLVVAARDTYGRDGNSRSFVASFAEVEVDVETGERTIVDYLAVGDVGTVINPRNLRGQILGGGMLGIGHAIGQKWVFDTHYGVPLARRFYQTRPPTILDAPRTMYAEGLNIPDPETPAGARGVGEPPVGAGYGAILNATAAAVGDEVYRRSPVMLDIIIEGLEAGHPAHEPLTTHI
jgi:CO/xanthine dehydrogenase Mo-binding subunit